MCVGRQLGLAKAGKAICHYSIEVRPSRMAYFVRAAMVCRSSFFMICRRWVSTVFTVITSYSIHYTKLYEVALVALAIMLGLEQRNNFV